MSHSATNYGFSTRGSSSRPVSVAVKVLFQIDFTVPVVHEPCFSSPTAGLSKVCAIFLCEPEMMHGGGRQEGTEEKNSEGGNALWQEVIKFLWVILTF